MHLGVLCQATGACGAGPRAFAGPYSEYVVYAYVCKHRYRTALDSGATVSAAVKVLNDCGVSDDKITLLNLFATEAGLEAVSAAHPKVD